MSRTFAYARVSTIEQNPENQMKEIADAGFIIEQHRMVTETISGSTHASCRKEFTRLLDKMERGDILVVTKLDRLGRDAIDVSTTIAKLEKMVSRFTVSHLGALISLAPLEKCQWEYLTQLPNLSETY